MTSFHHVHCLHSCLIRYWSMVRDIYLCTAQWTLLKYWRARAVKASQNFGFCLYGLLYRPTPCLVRKILSKNDVHSCRGLHLFFCLTLNQRLVWTFVSDLMAKINMKNTIVMVKYFFIYLTTIQQLALQRWIDPLYAVYIKKKKIRPVPKLLKKKTLLVVLTYIPSLLFSSNFMFKF